MELSIIILAFRNQEKLRLTLESVRRSQLNFSVEAIVVDNSMGQAMTESMRQDFPDVRVIENHNSGFSAGNNLGIRASVGKFILLLNPDTEVAADAIQLCHDFLKEHPDVGIVGPKLIKTDGTLDLAARRSFPNLGNSFYKVFGLHKIFPNSKRFGAYNRLGTDPDQIAEVDSVSGAFLMTRKDVVNRMGLLDERYFMYGEDIDWCWSCKAAGFKVVYLPQAVTIHHRGQSSKKTPFLALKHFHSAMWIFYKKHYAGQNFFLINWLVWLGVYSRLSIMFLINFFRKNPYVSK